MAKTGPIAEPVGMMAWRAFRSDRSKRTAVYCSRSCTWTGIGARRFLAGAAGCLALDRSQRIQASIVNMIAT